MTVKFTTSGQSNAQLHNCSHQLWYFLFKVAKTQFNAKQDPMDCSLYYMAIRKKTVLRGLFR